MPASKSNIGQIGVASIRIMGQTIEELPFGARERALDQLSLVLDTERQNKIENILRRFPKAKVLYLDSRITEAQENIVRLARTKAGLRENVSAYQALINAQHGRVSFHEIEPDIRKVAARSDLHIEEKMAQIHELKQDVADYEIDALKQQIEQFEESIVRFDETIQQENDSIAELRETIGACQVRDLELKMLGVKKAVIG